MKRQKIYVFQLGCQNADEVIFQAINLYGNEREGKKLSMSVTCIAEEQTGRRGTRGKREAGKGQEASAASWKEGRTDRLGLEAACEKIRKERMTKKKSRETGGGKNELLRREEKYKAS